MRSLAVCSFVIFSQFVVIHFLDAQYFHISRSGESDSSENDDGSSRYQALPYSSSNHDEEQGAENNRIWRAIERSRTRLQSIPRSRVQILNPIRVCPTARLEQVESFQFLVDWLSQHPEIDSLDDLIACLPERAFEFMAFGFESLAPEGEFVDGLHPRVILSMNRGQLFISFTGMTGTEDYEIMRAMEYNHEQERIDLHFLTFDLVGEENLQNPDEQFFHEINPNRCLGCHTEDPKPIWGEYRHWDGMYGSSSDAIWSFNDEEEYFGFVEFLDQQKHSSRYQRSISGHLEWDPHRRRDDFDRNEFDARFPVLPRNLLFTKQLGELNGRRMVARISEGRDFDLYKVLLGATYLRCQLPPEVEENINQIIQDQFEDDPILHPPRRSSPYQFLMEEEIQTNRDRDRQSIARMYFLTELLGLNPEDWDMFFGEEGQGWGRNGPGMNIGGDTVFDHSFQFFVPFLEELQEISEELAEYDWSLESLSLHYRSYRDPENFDHICEFFEEPLLEEMALRTELR